MHLGRGETEIGFEGNDGTRASFLGTSCGLRCLKGVAIAGFENKGKMGLPLAMEVCPDPSRVLAVVTFLAIDVPPGIAVAPALVVEVFCLALCIPVPLRFEAGLVCRGIRPWAAAGLGRVEVMVVWGLTPGPTLAENEVMDLPRGGEFLVEADGLKRNGPVVAVAVTE